MASGSFAVADSPGPTYSVVGLIYFNGGQTNVQ